MTEPKSRRHLFERGTPAHPVTHHQIRLLYWVAECGLITPPQIAELSGAKVRNVVDHMRNLFDHGLVRRVGVPPAALAGVNDPNSSTLLFGRAPTIYSLSKEGADLLVRMEQVDPDQVEVLPPDYGPKNWAHLGHELEVTDVRVWLENVRRANPDHEGVSWWTFGARAWIGLDRPGARKEVRPDAQFLYTFKEGYLQVLLEVDRGTERGVQRWYEKYGDYTALFEADEEAGYMVFVIAPNAARRDAIAATIAECAGGRAPAFWLTEKATLAVTDLTQPIWRVPGVVKLKALL